MSSPPIQADLHFYFDPVCPFAWMTSKWVRMVAAQRDYTVDWRFISLRLVNIDVDYAARFPVDYEAGHTAGLRLLRVAARARSEHGREAVGPLYAALGGQIFDTDPDPAEPGPADPDRAGADRAGADRADLDRAGVGAGPDRVRAAARRGSREFVEPLLAEAGLPASLADALEDASLDGELRAETDQARELTGKDVGTPILHFQPPTGVAFFGPVISRLPAEDDAAALWDHVIALAGFAGFAEIKRSLRELPQLRGLGVSPDQVGAQQDWHGGSRRQHR